MINISYDKEIDAKYVSIKKDKIYETKILKDWLNLDLNKKGDVLGIEILNASENPIICQLSGDSNLNIANIKINDNFLDSPVASFIEDDKIIKV